MSTDFTLADDGVTELAIIESSNRFSFMMDDRSRDEEPMSTTTAFTTDDLITMAAKLLQIASYNDLDECSIFARLKARLQALHCTDIGNMER